MSCQSDKMHGLQEKNLPATNCLSIDFMGIKIKQAMVKRVKIWAG